MRKLKLDAESLRVETFTPAAAGEAATRGTVQAHGQTMFPCGPTERNYPTCNSTCEGYTCMISECDTCLC